MGPMHSIYAGKCAGWFGMVVGCIVALAAGGAGEAQAYTVFSARSATNVTPVSQPTQHGTRVTLAVRDSTIEYVVTELTRQAHLHLLYDNGNPLFAKRISVHVTNVGVMDAVSLALRGTGLMATVAPDGETVVVRGASDVVAGRKRQQGGTVVGRVTDSTSGAGLGGAQVRLEGIKLGTVSSDSGQFTLRNVPPGDQVLLVRLFGYRPAERTVTVVDSERTTVRIAMVPVPTVLSGVVTTATGLQRKIEVGNDITTLNVDSIMQTAPVQSVTDLLETRVPGLTVLHTDGVPGDPSRLRLRGAGSIQLNNDPIIIIDGIRVYSQQSNPRTNNLAPVNSNSNTGSGAFAAPSPLDQLDPNSIESIEVLKGPSATAVYGSDAANGVVVITTKHGHVGPTHWDMALSDGINYLPGKWPVNYYRYGKGITSPGNPVQLPSLCNWYDLGCYVDSVVAFQALNDPNLTVMSQGNDRAGSLTISGGNQLMQYSATGSAGGTMGYLKLPNLEQQRYEARYGPIPHDLLRPDNLNTWGLGGTIVVQPSASLRVTFDSRYNSSVQQQSSLQGAVPQLEGTTIDTAILGTNPLITGELLQVFDNQITTQNDLTANWQWKPWLPITATVGLAANERMDHSYIPFGINGTGPENSGSDTSGYYGVGRGTVHNQTANVGTAIPLTRLHMMLALGVNTQSQSTADLATYTKQLAPGVTVPTSFVCGIRDFVVVNCPSTQSTSGATTYGWYIEPKLNFSSRFFVTPGFRLDGGSGGTRTTTSAGGLSGLSAFPKIDFSWIAVDRQNNRPWGGVLTLLRPRVAFGIAGTQPGPADKLRLYNVGLASYSLKPLPNDSLTYAASGCNPFPSLDGSTNVPAVCLDAVGNTHLQPEQSAEAEGGFDAALWRGRVNLTYTLSTKLDRNAILSIPIAPSVYGSGGLQYEKNIGEIRNTSTEMTANAFVIQNRAMSWNVGMNLTNANNVVVKLNKGQNPIVLATGNGALQERVTPGYPIFGVWAQPIVSFSDVNHDGIVEPNEIRFADSAVYLGGPNPKYQFNLTTNLAVLNGQLSFNATFAYTNGMLQTNQGACNSAIFTLVPNRPGTSLATQAAVMAAGCGVALSNILEGYGYDRPTNSGISGIGLAQVVNTFRFNDLSINYQVPKRISSWFRVPRMSVALQGSNLALHTNYRGLDPDVNAFSTVSAGDETVDLGQIPKPRMWQMRVTLGN